MISSVKPFFISAMRALSRAAFFTHRSAPLGRRSKLSSSTVASGAAIGFVFAFASAFAGFARSLGVRLGVRLRAGFRRGLRVRLGFGFRVRFRTARHVEAHDERDLVAHPFRRAVGDEGVARVAVQVLGLPRFRLGEDVADAPLAGLADEHVPVAKAGDEIGLGRVGLLVRLLGGGVGRGEGRGQRDDGGYANGAGAPTGRKRRKIIDLYPSSPPALRRGAGISLPARGSGRNSGLSLSRNGRAL